jgi:hypothetical protein
MSNFDPDSDDSEYDRQRLERRRARIQSLPMQAKLELDARVTRLHALIQRAVVVLSPYLRACYKFRDTESRRDKLFQRSVFIVVALTAITMIVGLWRLSMVPILVFMLATYVSDTRHRKRKDAEIDPLLREVQSLEHDWQALGLPVDALDEFRRRFLDVDTTALKAELQSDYRNWKTELELSLLQNVERVVS